MTVRPQREPGGETTAADRIVVAVAAAGYDPDPFLRRAFALWEEEQNLTDDGTLTSLANAVNLPGATPKDPQTSSKIA
jgi:2-hydroxychromene-2-carboxylate isomerase